MTAKRPRGRLRRRAEAAVAARRAAGALTEADQVAIGVLYQLCEALDTLAEPAEGHLEGIEARTERVGRSAYLAQTALRYLQELEMTPASRPEALPEPSEGLLSALRAVRDAS